MAATSATSVLGVKRVRTDLTAHVSTLEEYFAMGMTGARTDEQRAMIEEAAERTQLNTSTVKDWIRNHLRKIRQVSGNDEVKSKAQLKARTRKICARDVFMSSVLKTDEYLKMPEGQRLAAANAKWTGIKGTAAAESYEKQARERAAEMQQSQTQPAASSETSKQLGRKACRKLMKMIDRMRKEFECLVYFYDPTNYYLQTFGSEKAVLFADQEPEFEKRFMDFVGGQHTTSHDNDMTRSSKSALCSQVIDLFNERYSEKRCNYEAIARGVVSVVGLPTDLALKHPRMYGRGALKRILENKEELKFLAVLAATRSNDAVTKSEPVQVVEQVSDDIIVQAATTSNEGVTQPELIQVLEVSDDVIAGVATALNIGDIPMSVDAVTAALVTAVVSSKVTVEAESQKPTVGDVRETCNTRVQSDAAVRSSAASSDSATAGTELETVATSSASSDMDLTRKKSSARKSRSAGDNTSAKHSMPEQVSRKRSRVQNDEKVYVVEQILQRRRRHGVKQVLIKWKGFGAEFNTWEPEKNITVQ